MFSKALRSFVVTGSKKVAASSPSPVSAATTRAALVCGGRHQYLSTSSTSDKPFKVLGIQQVAIGCLDREPLMAIWKDVFGLEAHDTFRSEKENVEEDIVKLGPSPYEVEIDLMCPIDPDKSPKVHVPPLNHIGLWIDDLPAAVDWMTAKGVRFTPGGIRPGAAGHDVTFIHPKGNAEKGVPIGGAGVLLELVQAPPEVIEAFSK